MSIPTTPALIRERLFSQEPRLIEAAQRLATIIQSIPPEPRFANTHPRALIVGGFVRDALLGGHPKDIDVEVYGVAPERLEALLHQLYPGLVNSVGRSFGILKIHLGDDVAFDVSIPRRESKTGIGHTAFAIEGDPAMVFADAARRRDFTINALAADALTGELFDAFGGMDDLAAARLRVTDPERFQDDPLRVYRAMQFVARLALTVDSESRDLMAAMVLRGDIDTLSRERITEELKKLLVASTRPSLGFAFARDIGLIERAFPELHALINCPQEPEWHPEGDVWTHTMMVVDFAARIVYDPARNFSLDDRLDVVFGALCHDLGKPSTTNVEEGKIRSRGHEAAGEEPTRRLCQRLSFSERTVDAAIAIATQHLKPWALFRDHDIGTLTDAAYANAVRKLLKRIHPLPAELFLAATEADFRGRGLAGLATVSYDHGNLMRSVIAEQNLDEEPIKPLLSGRDLAAIGVEPGRRMGEIIRTIENLRDDGVLTTRAEALEEAKKLV